MRRFLLSVLLCACPASESPPAPIDAAVAADGAIVIDAALNDAARPPDASRDAAVDAAPDMGDADTGAADTSVSSDAMTPDAMTPDATAPDAATMGSACDAARIHDVTLQPGNASLVSGDTRGAPSDLLSSGCLRDQNGAPLEARQTPAEIVALTMPAGTSHLQFSLVNDGTDPNFDTVVEVRRDACTMVPPATCFDDTPGDFRDDVRSSGFASAPAGSRLFLVVTSYNPVGTTTAPQAGPWQMRLEAYTPTPPSLDAFERDPLRRTATQRLHRRTGPISRCGVHEG